MTATKLQSPAKLKIREYAERENVSVRTVKRWIEKGALKFERVGPTKRIRIVGQE